MRKLTTYVHVDGVQYGPTKTPPPEVAKRITNPYVWDGPADSQPVQPAAPGPGAAQPAPVSTPVPPPAASGGDSGRGTLPEPPRAGKGSGTEAWLAYAKDQGVVVPEGAGRDDIIAAVDEARG